MIEKRLRVFLDAIVHYFNHTTVKSVEVGTPYLIDSIDEVSSDYTGVISISGAFEGVCYFTAPNILLKHLVLSIGETDTSEQMLVDAVGEVANTLSGNARRDLGKDFIISVPRVIKGVPDLNTDAAGRTYAIPIIWNSYKATLGVCLAN